MMTTNNRANNVRLALIGAALYLGAAVVNAQNNRDDSGPYLTLFGGASFLGSDDLRLREAGGGRSDVDYDGGFISGAALGYRFSETLRLEGEFAYRTNTLSGADFDVSGDIDDGDFSSLAVGVNGYYEFAGAGRSLVPYVGLGLVWAQEIDIDFEQPGGEQSYSSDEFGFQAMLGARYQANSRWSINGELRYLSLGSVTLEREGGRGEVSTRYRPLSLLLGVGYRW